MAKEDIALHPKEILVGMVTGYSRGFATITLNAPLNKGDHLSIRGEETQADEIVDDMFLEGEGGVEHAGTGTDVRVRVSEPLRRGDMVYLRGYRQPSPPTLPSRRT